MRAYTAHLAANRGLLLGGLPMVRSAPFANRADAQAWLDQCIEDNREAGRYPGEGYLVPSDRWPVEQIIPEQDPAERFHTDGLTEPTPEDHEDPKSTCC